MGISGGSCWLFAHPAVRAALESASLIRESKSDIYIFRKFAERVCRIGHLGLSCIGHA